ncbi:hypothetical protein K435DRAFT_794780 [Dendrothele bispora CBS 962.96]|uniref:Uncharacterized protein n=1 Tax=Dendrothele bispora (strain CBS 962.96) TaxID=1314807 RepID=A0A4V4HGP5_DENBC|nr:hypothetical protein K435DRAFT_794780 [Dendrothele bispora CBS 962.96]
MLTKKLSSLSVNMDLFDPNGKISFGYDMAENDFYDGYSESDPEEVLQDSGFNNPNYQAISAPNSLVQPHQPVLPTNSSHKYRHHKSGAHEQSQTQNTAYTVDQTVNHALLCHSIVIFWVLNLFLFLSLTLRPSLLDLNSILCETSHHHYMIIITMYPFKIQSYLVEELWKPEDRDLLQQPPFSVESGGTYTSAFVVETGQSNTSKAPNGLRVDEMRLKIKEQFLSMLKSCNIDTGDKLPWRNLFKILRERTCQFENWLEDTPQPHTQNGIERAPQREIKALYKALLDRERPLRICRIDGCSGGADLRFILQDPPGSGSGTKRSRDEQGGEVEERESNRRGRE